MENKDKPVFLNVETCPHTGGVYTLQPGLTKEEYIATRLMQELFPKAFENVKGYYVNENSPLWLGYSEDGVKVKDVVDVGSFLNTRHQISDLTIHDRPATKEEVEERLIAAAKKSGLWDAEIEECNNPWTNKGEYEEGYDWTTDTLWSKNGCIYNKGKWVTPLKETMPSKLKELINELGKEEIKKWI